VWGDTLYQIRFHFERVESEGRCDIALSLHTGRLGNVITSEVALERERLP